MTTPQGMLELADETTNKIKSGDLEIIYARIKDDLIYCTLREPEEPRQAAAPQGREALILGDIVRMNERSPWFHEWRDIELKVVSLRVDPQCKQWVSAIDAPYNQGHRGNGVYDGETTDIDAEHLSKIGAALTPAVAPAAASQGREALEACRAYLVEITRPHRVGTFIGTVSSYHPCHALIDKIDKALALTPAVAPAANGEIPEPGEDKR